MSTKHMNFEGAFQLDAGLFKRIGVNAITIIKTRTQDGKGVRDNNRAYSFPAYSEGYRALKAGGMKKRGGGKLKQYAGVATDRQTSPPNFRLTGETMRDLTIRAVTKRAVEIGWRGPQATIVKAHMDKKKYQIGGVTINEQEELLKDVDDFLNRKFKIKTRNVSVNVRV